MSKLHSWSRTAEYYRERGYRVVKVEYTARGLRHDLMGFIDGIAFGIGHTIYLQACGQDWQPHVDKILGSCAIDAQRVILAGNDLVLIGWRRLKVRRGGKAVRWVPRIREFTMEDFNRPFMT